MNFKFLHLYNQYLNKKLFLVCSIAYILLSSGCQTTGSLSHKKDSKLSHLQYWQLKARIAITANNENISATLDWKKSVKDFDFHVYGLLGVSYAHLTQKDKLATLKLQKEQTVSAPSAQELLDDYLGWKFPINALSYWVKGVAYGHPQENISRNDNGEISSIEFDGWSVNFSQFKNYAGEYTKQHMPRIIKASHQQYGKIKIVVKKWQFLAEEFDVST